MRGYLQNQRRGLEAVTVMPHNLEPANVLNEPTETIRQRLTELPDASKAMTLAATRGVFDQFSPDLSISL
jgi:hypothetical protein